MTLQQQKTPVDTPLTLASTLHDRVHHRVYNSSKRRKQAMQVVCQPVDNVVVSPVTDW